MVAETLFSLRVRLSGERVTKIVEDVPPQGLPAQTRIFTCAAGIPNIHEVPAREDRCGIVLRLLELGGGGWSRTNIVIGGSVCLIVIVNRRNSGL